MWWQRRENNSKEGKAYGNYDKNNKYANKNKHEGTSNNKKSSYNINKNYNRKNSNKFHLLYSNWQHKQRCSHKPHWIYRSFLLAQAMITTATHELKSTIRRLNVYFTHLLHTYLHMLLLNYFTTKISSNINNPQEASNSNNERTQEQTVDEVTYTPQCIHSSKDSKKNKSIKRRRGSSSCRTTTTKSEINCNEFGLIKTICQWDNNNNNCSNNKKYLHKQKEAYRSACKVFVLLSSLVQHLNDNICVYFIKWLLLFEYFANYCIKMQIEGEEMAEEEEEVLMDGKEKAKEKTQTDEEAVQSTRAAAVSRSRSIVNKSTQIANNSACKTTTTTVIEACENTFTLAPSRCSNTNAKSKRSSKITNRATKTTKLAATRTTITTNAAMKIIRRTKGRRSSYCRRSSTRNKKSSRSFRRSGRSINRNRSSRRSRSISNRIFSIFSIFTAHCCCFFWSCRCSTLSPHAMRTTSRRLRKCLNGICIIRLISLKDKNILQIPKKQSNIIIIIILHFVFIINIILKRLKNCLSIIISAKNMKQICHQYAKRKVLEAYNGKVLLLGKVLDVTEQEQEQMQKQQLKVHTTTNSPQLQSTPPPALRVLSSQIHSQSQPKLQQNEKQKQKPEAPTTQSTLSPPLSPLLGQLPPPSSTSPLPLQCTAQLHRLNSCSNLKPQMRGCCGFVHRLTVPSLLVIKSVVVACLARFTDYYFAFVGACWHWRWRWFWRPFWHTHSRWLCGWPFTSLSSSSSSSSSSSLLHRSLTVLILLSSLWHGTECFHGSVKLTANTVKTKYGLLRGIVVRSSPLVEAYLGIPYASPPVGSLRFMPPITPSTWKNVRNADRFSAVCPQTVPIPPNGPEALLEVPRSRLAQLRRLLPLLSNQSEDCLYLNIYVPYENRRKRRSASPSSSMEHIPDPPSSILATILLIHGESYEWNSGNPYDGSELAAQGNVIVVTINFRLGIFGFLKTGGKESAQGNFGLMDLVAGLHWLKENLPAFGGDPQRITLLGHSTGAALANILVVSPVASDLLQRAVLVSGSALSPWAIQKNPLFVKRRVAEQTGCHGDMLYDDLAPCLRTKSVAELLAVKIDHPRFLSGFAPFIDGTVISPNADPIGELTLPLGSAIVSTSGIEFANFPKRDLIFCLTSVESYLDLSAQDLEFGFNETRRDRILRTFVRNNFHYHLNEIFAVLKNEYTDWEKAIRSPLSSRDATLSFLSDGHTAAGLIKLGYMHSLRSGRSYFLHFKHRTVEEEYPQRTGSVRGEDVPFWLGLPISPLFPHNYTTQEKQISRLMLRYLANFAKTGNPNHSGFDTPFISPSTSRSPAFAATQFDYGKVKRASLKTLNAVNKYFNLTTTHLLSLQQQQQVQQQNGNALDANAALNLALFYNQRRTLLRDRRAYYKRHLRNNNNINEIGNSNNNNNNNESNEMSNDEPIGHSERLPFWDAYDVVNQLYLELGNKAEVQSHYRGHKLSMWLNLIPQLHKHSNINDQSMRHHQFPDDLNNRDLYEGVVRPQMQTKPTDDEDTVVVKMPKSPTKIVSNNTKNAAGGGTATTECITDAGNVYANAGDNTTTQQPIIVPSSENRTTAVLLEGGGGTTQQKDLATASTGLIGNLEMFRRLNGKQFPDYTTVLVATIAVGCFLLALNILIFAGIYHQREKRARDAKTKEELQDTDTSKNSSILKLNTVGSIGGGGIGDDGDMGTMMQHFDGKSTAVLFGEYNYYDEKPKGMVKEKLLVDLPPTQTTTTAHMELNWPGGGGGGGGGIGGSTSTLDLLKTKHTHHPHAHHTLEMVPTFSGGGGGKDFTNLHGGSLLTGINSVEMATYSGGGGGPMPCPSGLAVHESTVLMAAGIPSRRSSFAATIGGSQTSMQFDYAVQSSDQLSFKDIEDAVKASADDMANDMDDMDIPEPPPPPRSFQSVHHQQQQQQQQLQQQQHLHQQQQQAGILRPSGSGAATSSGGKKRVHIQEISV